MESGCGPNEYFIKQLARTTGGAFELISPAERIEPSVLRLFSKLFSANSIQNLQIDWGTNVVTAGIPSAIFFGETVSIFAKLDGNEVLPDQIRLIGDIRKSRQEWVAGITPINLENTSLPSLWARAKIHELEESEIAGIGSQQFDRKEAKIKESIINLSKTYGIISRETSFVAVEQRSEKEKTTGELVLRKVPLLLTRGWGNIYDIPVDEFDLSVRTMNSVRRGGITTVGSLISKNQKELLSPNDFGQKSRQEVEEKLKSLGLTLQCDNPPDKPKTNKFKENIKPNEDTETALNPDDELLHILSLQKAKAGFEIDATLAKVLKVSLADLHSWASMMKVKGKSDKFILLSTAIILKYLEYQFANQKASWEAVARKSQRWLEVQILKAEPTIEGKNLIDWIDQFLKKQGVLSIH
jgi:hypothetical protein